MPKMPRDLSGYKVTRILKHNSFRITRQKGSHIAMEKKMKGQPTKKLTVPNHDPVTIGTLGKIAKDCGKGRNKFIRVSQKI